MTEDDGKAGGGWRALAAVLAVALLFAGAVMVAVGVDIGDTPIGIEGCRAEPGCTEYFDGSETERTIQVILLFATGALAAIAAILAIAFAITGRRGGLLLRMTAIAIAAGVIALLFGSVT